MLVLDFGWVLTFGWEKKGPGPGGPQIWVQIWAHGPKFGPLGPKFGPWAQNLGPGPKIWAPGPKIWALGPNIGPMGPLFRGGACEQSGQPVQNRHGVCFFIPKELTSVTPPDPPSPPSPLLPLPARPGHQKGE